MRVYLFRWFGFSKPIALSVAGIDKVLADGAINVELSDCTTGAPQKIAGPTQGISITYALRDRFFRS